MAMAVGLDIGSEAVRAAAVEVNGRVPVLRRFAVERLPRGAVACGEIIDEEAVGGALRALWKHQRLPRRRVVVGIAGPRITVRRLEIPAQSEGELRESLPEYLQGVIPTPIEEAVVDYLPLGEPSTPSGEPALCLLAVAAHRETVESAVAVAKRAGLGVTAVDLTAFGLARAAFGAALGRETAGPQGLLDIGATLSQVVVVRGGMARAVGAIPVGGSRFTEALVEGAGLSWEEAEQRKRITGVTPHGAPAGEGERAALGRLLAPVADDLIERVRAVLEGYYRENGGRSLERLVVSGNGARLPHLARRVAHALEARVEPVRVLDHFTVGRVRLTEPELLKLQPVLPAAAGLALWGSFVLPPGGGFAHLE